MNGKAWMKSESIAWVGVKNEWVKHIHMSAYHLIIPLEKICPQISLARERFRAMEKVRLKNRQWMGWVCIWARPKKCIDFSTLIFTSYFILNYLNYYFVWRCFYFFLYFLCVYFLFLFFHFFFCFIFVRSFNLIFFNLISYY